MELCTRVVPGLISHRRKRTLFLWGTFFVTFVSRFMFDSHFPLGKGETGFGNPFSREICKFLHCEKEGNVNRESTIFDA